MPSIKGRAFEIAALRRLLTGSGSRLSWQALENVAESAEFHAFVQSSHPSLTPMLAGPGRRRVLQVMAASLALGGLTGCDQRGESSFSEIIPYVNQPTSLTPSVPLSYASATLLDGFANGALVTTIDGRPIKIEGNAEHPWTRGATDLFMQAWVLGLYDPDRSQTVRHLSRPADWDTFRTVMLSRFTGLRAVRGQGLHLLTGPVSSPAILAQIVRMRNAFPEMHWHVHAPVGRDSVYAGAQQAFGKPVNIPRQSRGLYGVGRSKRPGGSLTRPVECEPLKAASGTANAVPGSVGH